MGRYNIDDINFDDIDWSKYQKEIDEIDKAYNQLLKSKSIQKLLIMMERSEMLGLEDDCKLKSIDIKDNIVKLTFKGRKNELAYVTIDEIIELYNYMKG